MPDCQLHDPVDVIRDIPDMEKDSPALYRVKPHRAACIKTLCRQHLAAVRQEEGIVGAVKYVDIEPVPLSCSHAPRMRFHIALAGPVDALSIAPEPLAHLPEPFGCGFRQLSVRLRTDIEKKVASDTGSTHKVADERFR